MYFNVNLNVFFKIMKVRLLVSELYKEQPLLPKQGIEMWRWPTSLQTENILKNLYLFAIFTKQ